MSLRDRGKPDSLGWRLLKACGAPLRPPCRWIAGRLAGPLAAVSAALDAMDSAVSRGIRSAIEGICIALAFLHRWVSWGLGKALRGILYLLGRLPLPARLVLLFVLAGGVLLLVWIYGHLYVSWPLDEISSEEFEKQLDRTMLDGHVRLCGLALIAALLQVPAIALAFVRRRISLVAIRVAAAAYTAFWLCLLYFLDAIPRMMYAAEQKEKLFTAELRDPMWLVGMLLWAPGAMLGAVGVVCVSLRSVREHYTRDRVETDSGADKILQSLLTHGSDPRYRTSNYWAAFAHVLVLVLPFLFLIGSCAWYEYAYPKGSGTPFMEAVAVKLVKPKKKKRIVLNMDSPILFARPDIDDSEIREDLEQETLDTYVASSLRSGKLGAGGGTTGGWPHGKAGKVGFVRLEYNGGDWDQDMGHGADYNLLIEFNKITGFPIKSNSEHIPVSRLRRYKKHRKPPFVFVTGRGAIGLSSADIKALRWYALQDGGLIFADNGGGSFDYHLRRLMRRVFPGKQWIDIPNDDVIYRQPFAFPAGAPPLWHHSGTRALGLKHNGRWIVFYHQGDINDAWKTGHSGAKKHLAAAAYKLGINIMYYAFTQYDRIHGGQ